MHRVVLLTMVLALAGCQNSLTRTNNEHTTYEEMLKDSKPGKHAYFNDKGTLQWYNDKTFGSALKSGKPLILELGREQCGLCKKFVEQVLPKFKNKVKGFAGVESNVDNMTPAINALVRKHMRHATLLPVIMILDKNGKFVGGLYGDISSQRTKFGNLLKKAKNIK